MDLFESPSPQAQAGLLRRYSKHLFLTSALCVAAVLTVVRAPQLRAAQPPAADEKRPYDLAALKIFQNTLMRINDSYVDPTRVDPRQMLLSALDQVQKSVAEVLVEPKGDKSSVVVRVDTAQQEFKISDVDSPWALSFKMREIFKFISQNLAPGTDKDTVRSIEYAATNGMLSTLDPHSTLLEPTLYNEMKMNTRGSFGGLGIVIGIRKGALTVIKPMPETPAARAGIKAGDRIVRIDKLSTVNLMLQDAVNKLRGDPDTQVEIWLEKGGEKAPTPKKVVLTRAVIQVKTVEGHLLKNGVGYIKLFQSFGGNTVDEMRRALDDLKSKGIKSLVFDLRNNPGGLLDQAIKVTDEFVDSGTIVTTVGFANTKREEKRANPGNQPHFPMAVLVNHGSASASEIVAGALKNLDRAVIVGTRTFGKGSVQVLYDNDDGSALKLTIAQYLTPGDISIQSVGITPDVMLEKVAVDKAKGVWLYRDYKGMSESELESHLESKNTRSGDKPFETIKYLAADAPKKPVKTILRDDDKQPSEDDDPDAEPEEELAAEDTFVEDYEIKFAADLVAQAKGWKRREVLASSKAYFDKRTAEEQGRVVEALKKLNVDWTPVGVGAKPTLVVSLATDVKGDEVRAGDTVNFKGTVTNKTGGVAGQVRAVIKSADWFLDGREFVFGKIKPGETRTFMVPVKIPKDALSRIDPLKLEVFEEHGATASTDNELRLTITGLPRPVFAYAYQIIDDVHGNGDGLVQRGESVRLHVTVKNTGAGKSNETLAQLRNLSDEGLDINKGRFNVDNLQPGEQKSVDFTFDVKNDYKPDTFKVELSVYDAILHEYVTDKLSFPVAAAVAVQPAADGKQDVMVTTDKDKIYGAASKDAVVVGTLPKGTVLKRTANVGDYARVELEPGRPGFLATSTVSATADAPTPAKWEQTWQVSPPRVELATQSAITEAPTIRIKGTARDDHKLADVFIFVSNRGAKIDRRKVFYRSNRNGPVANQLGFEAEVPLWPGANVVTVVARENTQVQSQETVVIERTGAKVAASPVVPDKTLRIGPGPGAVGGSEKTTPTREEPVAPAK